MKQTLLLYDNLKLEIQELPLDFANTADWHASEQPVESLNSYVDLVAWAQEHGLLTETGARQLTRRTENEPDAAVMVLNRAISLREAIYRIFSATSAGRSPQPNDLATLNLTLREAFKHVRVAQEGSEFSFQLVDTGDKFEQMLWPVAYAAAELLTSADLNRVKECEDDRGCGFLFFDTSKNRTRRWCSMRWLRLNRRISRWPLSLTTSLDAASWDRKMIYHTRCNSLPGSSLLHHGA